MPVRGRRVVVARSREDAGARDLRSHRIEMPKQSAGLLLFRQRSGLELFLVHPGGPYWARRDEGAWSIPKGEIADGEEALDCAIRELAEETGIEVSGPFLALGSIQQKGGKRVRAWAVEFDFDPDSITSGTFSIEWPPRSGIKREFPEVDRAAWFAPDEAKRKILAAQIPLIEELQKLLE